MKIKTSNHSFEVELYNTPTAKKISEGLPFSARAILWGKEIYFSIPVDCEMESSARDILQEGEIAFYPPMNAFCIFFGPTPVSNNDGKPRAADLVNVFGKIKGDFTLLEEVEYNEQIEITE